MCGKILRKYIVLQLPISGVESVTGNISPTIVAKIVIASMIVTSEKYWYVIVV